MPGQAGCKVLSVLAHQLLDPVPFNYGVPLTHYPVLGAVMVHLQRQEAPGFHQGSSSLPAASPYAPTPS